MATTQVNTSFLRTAMVGQDGIVEKRRVRGSERGIRGVRERRFSARLSASTINERIGTANANCAMFP